jgi:ABC-type lipoprotein release transport system permease subunit
MLSWKIAWRNVWRHKGKSLVIGVIIFIGAFLMTVGNAVIEGAKDGMAENMVNRFTGHIMLKAANEKKDEVLFGAPSSLKVIPDYPGVKSLLQQQDFIESFVPMTRGVAMILNPDGDSDETFIFGVNFEDYQRTFLNNVLSEEGQLLTNGDRGMLITEYTREKLYDNNKFWLVPEGMSVEQTVLLADTGTQATQNIDKPEIVADARERYDQGTLKTVNDLIILGFSSSSLGTDIRVPVKGIIKFHSLNKVWQEVSFMDIESYRESFGHISAENNAVELTDQQQAILQADSMDDLFGDADVVQETDINTEGYDLEAMQQQTQRSDIEVDTDQGAYHLVAVKLQPGIDMPDAKARLQEIVDKTGVQVKVLTWKQAVGEVAQFATITQGALFVFVMFIFFVAIIVIMNTLSMAALERIAEIGMMRAIGAQKGFVSKMFLSETFILAFIFGGAGMITGIAASLILAAIGIPVTGNELLSLLFGGDTFNPVIKGPELISGIIQLGIVTVLAVIYPLLIARKITPLEAISRD